MVFVRSSCGRMREPIFFFTEFRYTPYYSTIHDMRFSIVIICILIPLLSAQFAVAVGVPHAFPRRTSNTGVPATWIEQDLLFPSHKTADALNNDLTTFYSYWKKKYLIKVGPSSYRIPLGKSGSNRKVTVSEGMGYGFLIANLAAGGMDPEAQAILEGLYRFFASNPSRINHDLMAWRVPTKASDRDSAFDGDCDMAYGMLMAANQFPSPPTAASDGNYTERARRLVSAVLKSTVGEETHLPMLGDWVSMSCPRTCRYSQWTPRTSDFMISHFRAFEKFSSTISDVAAASSWSRAVNATSSLIESLQTRFAPQTGLLPDFVVPERKGGGTGFQPAAPNFLESADDGHYDYNAGRFVVWPVLGGLWFLAIHAWMDARAHANSLYSRTMANSLARARLLRDPWRLTWDVLLSNSTDSRRQVGRMAKWVGYYCLTEEIIPINQPTLPSGALIICRAGHHHHPSSLEDTRRVHVEREAGEELKLLLFILPRPSCGGRHVARSGGIEVNHDQSISINQTHPSPLSSLLIARR